MNNFNRLIDILENVKQAGLSDRTEEFKKGFVYCLQFIYIHFNKYKDYYNQQLVIEEQENEIEKLKVLNRRLLDKNYEYMKMCEGINESTTKQERILVKTNVEIQNLKKQSAGIQKENQRLNKLNRELTEKVVAYKIAIDRK